MPSSLIPIPKPLQPQSSPYDLKERLDWGEPALTIVDVRDRQTFNQQHIMGAICMPMSDLVAAASQSLEADRDIYVYGATDEQTAEAALRLRQYGFMQVAELKGGLSAWKAIRGSVEGAA
ncbi:rhodanese-like domain-containing protein [Lyngbya confervoides]|uniref:Rhodanese-like domain-containing protein n=1 Tax=Lyngbya confervoides BDU141951 TaxID=1574623 RepID=A0ABD4T0G8_9CYAN|nr:rhodanese-like domain-containing protein [Lyngbya confervoides]MCM1982064.1 rhodanese-like domain-containing protein [Lyngbya confervoides BDU141951]